VAYGIPARSRRLSWWKVRKVYQVRADQNVGGYPSITRTDLMTALSTLLFVDLCPHDRPARALFHHYTFTLTSATSGMPTVLGRKGYLHANGSHHKSAWRWPRLKVARPA